MKNQIANNNISFVGLLTIAFIVLKLTGYISWNWWWVLSPLWIEAAIFFAIILICFIFAAVRVLAKND